MAKGYRLFIVILVLTSGLVGGQANAQQVRAGVVAGLNLAQVDGDEIYGFNKPGFNAGLFASVPIGKNFFFSLETDFNQKGSHQGKQYELQDTTGAIMTGAYDLRLNYLEVPVLFFYNDKNVLAAGGGFSYGRLVGITEKEHGKVVNTTTLNSGIYDRNDFNILADIRFRIYKNFKGNIRYAYSLVPIRTREFTSLIGDKWTRKQYNNVISFRIIYTINEKLPPVKDKSRETGF